jgi:hypothetical protein
MHSTAYHLISLRSILILSSHLCLRLSNSFYVSSFESTFCMQFSSLPCVLHVLLYPSLFGYSNNIWRRVQVQITDLHFMRPSSVSLYSFLLTSKYSPRHSFLMVSNIRILCKNKEIEQQFGSNISTINLLYELFI